MTGPHRIVSPPSAPPYVMASPPSQSDQCASRRPWTRIWYTSGGASRPSVLSDIGEAILPSVVPTGHPASWRMSALVGMSVLPVRDSGVPPVPDRGGHLLRGVFLGNVAAARDDDRAVSREHPLVTVQKAR